MILHQCDKCKYQSSDSSKYTTLRVPSTHTLYNTGQINENDLVSWEVCEDCLRFINKWLREKPAEKVK